MLARICRPAGKNAIFAPPLVGDNVVGDNVVGDNGQAELILSCKDRPERQRVTPLDKVVCEGKSISDIGLYQPKNWSIRAASNSKVYSVK